MLKTKSEIKEKLDEAEKELGSASGDERVRLAIVIISLRWVLGIRITQEPKDPVVGE